MKTNKQPSVEEIVEEKSFTAYNYNQQPTVKVVKVSDVKKTLQTERKRCDEMVEAVYREIREAKATCPEAYGFDGKETFPNCGKCIICKALTQPNNK